MSAEPERADPRATRARRLGAWTAAVSIALSLCACGPRRVPVVPTVTPHIAAWREWSTLRSDHRVVVEVRDDGGRVQQRRLRGAIAVERPDRFRLRALGPGGITVFDILFHDGKVQVLESLRDPNAEAFTRLLPSIAGDLAATFDLAPRPAGRTVRIDGDAIVIDEPERQVRLESFRPVPGGVAPTRITIESRKEPYRVDIEAADTELGVALDPALFR